MQELQAATREGKPWTKMPCSNLHNIEHKTYDDFQCDEARPACQKCIGYGVSCNYNPGPDEGQELQLSFGGEGQQWQQITFMSKPAQSEPQVPPRDSLSPLESGVDIIDGLLDREIETFTPGESYVLRKEDIDVLKRFQNRTVYTIGTQRSVHVYREQIIGMVCSVRPLTCHL